MGGSESKTTIYSVQVPDSQSVLSTSIYRNPEAQQSIILPKVWGHTNFFELFHFTSNKFAEREWLGSRFNNIYEWASYLSSSLKVLQLANAIDSLRITENTLGMNLLGILSENRKEVLFIEIACMGAGVITSCLNDKDSDAVLTYKIQQLHLKYLCVDRNSLGKIIKMKTDSLLEELEFVIALDPIDERDIKSAGEAGIGMYFIGDCRRFETKFTGKPIDSKATCMLVFTSGTTGNPKIVKVSHESLMCSFTGLLHGSYKLNADDVYVSVSHLSVFSEKILVYVATICGASIGFSKNPSEDLKILRPTIFTASPRYLDFLHAQLQDELTFQSSISRKLFHNAFKKKLKRLNQGKDIKSSMWDSMAFSSIKEKFGGRLRLIFTGSGLVYVDILKFFKIVLNCDIIEFYGSVECGEFSLCSGRDFNYAHVGGPLASCEVKLAYLPDTQFEGYENVKYGELCVRNTSAHGYLLEEITDSEGWMRTGDVFRLMEDSNCFVYIDRVEYIMKTRCGKAISPQKLEMIYRTSPYIAQIIVFSDYRTNGLVAIAVPDERYVMKHWRDGRLNFEEICEDTNFVKHLIRNLGEIGASKGLKCYEMIKEMVIEKKPWTSNELITTTLKVKRLAILNRYQTQIQEMVQKVLSIS